MRARSTQKKNLNTGHHIRFRCESFYIKKEQITKRLPQNPKELPFFSQSFGTTITATKGKTETE